MVHLVQYIGQPTKGDKQPPVFARGSKFLMVGDKEKVTVADTNGVLHYDCDREDFSIIHD